MPNCKVVIYNVLQLCYGTMFHNHVIEYIENQQNVLIL